MTAAKTISIPFEGQTSSGGRKGVPSLSDDINAEAWALSLTLRQNELTYSLGGVGMAPEADESIDNYDDVTPPRFIDFLELNFDRRLMEAGIITALLYSADDMSHRINDVQGNGLAQATCFRERKGNGGQPTRWIRVCPPKVNSFRRNFKVLAKINSETAR